jgi:hypothetical protein
MTGYPVQKTGWTINMAFTLNQLAGIESAIATGQLKVFYDGKHVEYRSMSDLLKARTIIRGELIELGLLSDAPQGSRASVTVFGRE